MFDMYSSADSCCRRFRLILRPLTRHLGRDGACSYVILLAGVDNACVSCSGGRSSLLHRDMPVDTTGLLGLFDPSHFLPPCWAGIAPCSVSIFADCTLGSEAFHSLLLAVLRLVLLCTIAANLGCVALSSDVAVVVAAEALFHSAGAVVELALMYLAIPCHSGVDDGIGHFWVCEFNDNRGCSLESGFLG